MKQGPLKERPARKRMKSMMLFCVIGVLLAGGCRQAQGPVTNAARPSAMIGVAIGTNGVVDVRQVVEGFPADLAGIRPGDEILQIDGRSTTGMPLQAAVELLRGPQGSPVTVVIRGITDNTTRSVTLGRRLGSPNAKWKKHPDSPVTGLTLPAALPLPSETVAPF